MTDMIPTWMASLTASEQRRLTGLLLLAIVLILLYLFRDSLHYWREGCHITRAAKRLGARMLRDVRLPDGMGGEISIDFLVLAADAILVIGVKRYDGLIYGSARIDEWTQSIRNRSYKFPNPDTYLQQQIGAVRMILPGIPVRGLHLFSDSAVFPKDKPSNVMQVKDLHGSIRRPRLKDIPAKLQTAWAQLMNVLD
jgi:Nuclease-related domain